MTRDPAILISPGQKWLNTQHFLAKLDENQKKRCPDNAYTSPAQAGESLPPGLTRRSARSAG